MADKLEQEYDDRMKKKLHKALIDIIENWLKNKLMSLRKRHIDEIKRKNDKNINFFMKNQNIDTGIEKHIKWYSKGRRVDVRKVIYNEISKIKQQNNE